MIAGPPSLVSRESVREQIRQHIEWRQTGVARVPSIGELKGWLAAIPSVEAPASGVSDAEWSDRQIAEFMCIALRHAQYKRGCSPSVQDIRDGFRLMNIQPLQLRPSGEDRG